MGKKSGFGVKIHIKFLLNYIIAYQNGKQLRQSGQIGPKKNKRVQIQRKIAVIRKPLRKLNQKTGDRLGR